ncbi:MAG: anti sigma factor C-terminal domain-containing protein [Clostridium sp.]|uniref:anti sigma factor C-terminal domain-containing protein n=1 Tax=Clostridium sp. TaxID=1506 RepID=UPI003D6D2841
MKSDDEKLRELFEVKEKPTFNNAIKRAKNFSIIRNIIVSFMILIIVSFIVLMLNATILNTMSNKTEDDLEDWFNVAMPNAYVGNIQVDDRIMVGQIDYVRYRFLGNRPITDGNYKEGYTYMPLINGIYGDMSEYLFTNSGESSKESDEIINYNKVDKRVMKFYNPSIKYESYINDLENLNEIVSNKLMEISLSFDKTYSLEQVKTMIPRGITLNWYWVNTFSKNDKHDSSKSILEEYDVYGIKVLDSGGTTIKEPEKDFINAIIRGKEKKDHSSIYESIYDTLSNGKGEINKEDLKIIGVVVSGNVGDLKALKDKSYIKAATIGAVTDKY